MQDSSDNTVHGICQRDLFYSTCKYVYVSERLCVYDCMQIQWVSD